MTAVERSVFFALMWGSQTLIGGIVTAIVIGAPWPYVATALVLTAFCYVSYLRAIRRLLRPPWTERVVPVGAAL